MGALSYSVRGQVFRKSGPDFDPFWTRFGAEIPLFRSGSGQNQVQIRYGRRGSEGGPARRGRSGWSGRVASSESLEVAVSTCTCAKRSFALLKLKCGHALSPGLQTKSLWKLLESPK